MRIEVICTGDELLTGLTADTNSPYFMTKALELGEKVALSQCVPDDRQVITQALREVALRADFVLVSGGLGPTSDDFTAECAAAAAGVPLVEHTHSLERIRNAFAKRGIEFTANNSRQALVPQGAEVFDNPVGSAPMFVQKMGRCTLCFVPGVPREYRALVDKDVLPRLQRLLRDIPGRKFRALKVLKTVGLPESHLDAQVTPLAQKHPLVTFGYRTTGLENQLKLLVEAESEVAAQKAIDAAEADCRSILDPYIFGSGEDTLPGVIGKMLVERGEKFAAVESCTGGAIGDLVTGISGSSDWFWGSAVTYSNEAKQLLAGVQPETLEKFGAVSEQVAAEMAQGLRAQSKVAWTVSTTGYAGPKGGDEKNPVGTVYFAVAGPSGVPLWVDRKTFRADRALVRNYAAVHALELLRRKLMEAR